MTSIVRSLDRIKLASNLDFSPQPDYVFVCYRFEKRCTQLDGLAFIELSAVYSDRHEW